MSIIVCDGVTLSYGADTILNNVTLAVNEGDKVGVIGVNGAGKSTLFSIIKGGLDTTSGNVYISNGATVGCLEQINDAYRFGSTIYEAALLAFKPLIDMENEISVLRARMESGDESAIKPFTDYSERFNIHGGNEFRAKTKSMLAKFGFGEPELDKPADMLSGGQKTKLLLVRLLLSDPDVMLLDEPTNHLDAQACVWLEGYINSSKKTFLIISHDRYFLDRTTNKTVEISHGEAETYDGNYTTFREKKRALDEAKLKHYNLQQKEIARLEAFIENQRKWNREKNIIAAESRQKTIDKMIKLEKPKEKEKGISFSISGSGSMSNDVLSVRGLSKSFGQNELFKDVSFELKRGERLFVIGANGCGKSTLIKILTGRLQQDSGVFEFGYNQTVGYYDQEQQLLDQSNTVIDEIWSVYSDKTNTQIRSMLAHFGFRGDDVFKTVSVLSGGERARLSIAKMVACGVSVLVLDEPTNHLDIDSRETLEQALLEYDGTIICVSHDRYFINSVATAILEIDKEGFDKGYCCQKTRYNSYIEKRIKKEALVIKNEPGVGKAGYEEAKQRKNQYRSAKNRYSAVEKEISDLEAAVSEMNKKENDESILSDYVALNELFENKSKAEEKLESLYEELERLENIISSYSE